MNRQTEKRILFRLILWCCLPMCFFFFVFPVAGCGPGQMLSDEQNGTREKAPLAYYEATLRPSEFDEEVETVQQSHGRHGQSVTPVDLPSDSTVVETVEVQGFRIQVFASANIDEAVSARETARTKVGNDSVYVVYDPPVYKVRVGDYATRLEASQRLPRIVNLGYPDAWVVSDKITLRRVTRIPRPGDLR